MDRPADGVAPLTPEPAPELVGAPPQTLGDWLRENGTQLVVVAAFVGAVCYFLHPLDVLLAGFGMSLIIFLHELGHFAAAKLCDVHVKTFSIGFGPAVPFCQVKYGETTYKLAMIPLGGFVAMVGENEEQGDLVNDAADEPDPPPPPGGDANPRSFKNKPVWQRMIIISAGVTMNLLLAAALFIAIYMNGVEEKPAIVAQVEPGSAAWRAGLQSGSEITRINGRDNPWFADIPPIVSSTAKGELVSLDVAYRGQSATHAVEPVRAEGALYPQLGVLSVDKLTLRHFKRDPNPPVLPGSAAAQATGSAFQPGDEIVAMTDPAAPTQLTPLNPSLDGLPGAFFDYHRRLVRLADWPVTFQVKRRNSAELATVTVPPHAHRDTGLRMRPGAISAVRQGSPAEKAGVQVRAAQGNEVANAGDQIVSVSVTEADGAETRYTTEPAELAAADPRVKSTWLDPLRLPRDLDQWSDRQAGSGAVPRKVRLTVLRDVDHALSRRVLELDWDPAYRYEVTQPSSAGSPIALNGLGLAYHVQAVVNRVEANTPAAAAGLKENDRVTRVRYQKVDFEGKESSDRWEEVRPHQWAFVDAMLQLTAPHKLTVKVERDGQEIECELATQPDPTWGLPSRGLLLMAETRTQKASNVGEALEMGGYRTLRAVKQTYQGLYAIVAGRVSVKAMQGPLSLARNSYFIAGEDVWHLLLWMALISVNLAVVNFLPVPVLDGGHMVFLSYEALRGKPAPVAVQVILTYVGLAMILCLMLFVIGLDVWRLIF